MGWLLSEQQVAPSNRGSPDTNVGRPGDGLAAARGVLRLTWGASSNGAGSCAKPCGEVWR